MKSFRHEIENPLVQQDIIELERKIHAYKNGQLDEEKFRSLRLARGVYGQRQEGVQMIRIKLPYGKMTFEQFERICRVSDKYSNGHVHFTTRQDIQIHHVSLDDSPKLWAYLERSKVTLREACGNTVRNITASSRAGVDPLEPFDVTPYAHEAFEYFLRKPICQEMGRKFKIAFASSEEDEALTYIHDLGFIPRILKNGVVKRGFRVLVGGGLGAQPHKADVLYEFLPEEKIIGLIEATLRLFDQMGERNKRFKARFKFLYKEFGKEKILQMIEEHKASLGYDDHWIPQPTHNSDHHIVEHKKVPTQNPEGFEDWKRLNTFEQKQKGFFAVGIKVPLGNWSTKICREFMNNVQPFVGDDIRVTRNQGLMLRFVPEHFLSDVFASLKELGLDDLGFYSVADIIACPGTDTCNLGISNSTAISLELEEILKEEYPHLLEDRYLKINISGCMNSCGQHSVSSIGFHGSSMKADGKVVPALQVLLGGINLGNGEARFGDKVIKIPSRRGPKALRTVLNEWEREAQPNERFADFYLRMGKIYFYDLLKPLADLSNLKPHHFVDWGSDDQFETAIGVGECAGVTIDLVSTLLYDGQEKVESARHNLEQDKIADSIYLSYSALIISAKALLIQADVKTNTHTGIVRDFDEQFTGSFSFSIAKDFGEVVKKMKLHEPSVQFASAMLHEAENFLNWSTVQSQTQTAS